MARRRRKKSSSSMFGMLAVLVVLVAVICALSVEMISLKERDQELARQEASALKDVEEAEQEQEDLEEQRIYVQTKQYIIEMAMERWGLVMPDVVVLKPAE